MNQQHASGNDIPSDSSSGDWSHNGSEAGFRPFPWDIGVFDAHCHPTDTIASIASVRKMKTRALTVMSTRSQDQDLVSDLATRHGFERSDLSKLPGESCVVPCFGWHPWFSYQLYDDTVPSPTYDGTQLGKTAHYDAILAPSPSSKDPSFSASLPDPIPLSRFLKETRTRLEKHPVALVGEIGLDKVFRLPNNWTAGDEVQRDEGLTPGGREGRQLSPFRVHMAHQAAILRAQLKLAGEMGRAVSVHGVQAHGSLYETISACWKGHEKTIVSRRQQKLVAEGAEDFSSSSEDEDGDPEEERPRAKKPKPYPPRICLHSFSGPVEELRRYVHPTVPAKVYFSFSTAVNWPEGGGSDKVDEAVRAAPADRILVESDLHEAGEAMDRYLEQACRKICRIRGWGLREGVERLARNWQEFVFPEPTSGRASVFV